jgi:hypothetical protein
MLSIVFRRSSSVALGRVERALYLPQRLSDLLHLFFDFIGLR